ncbi:hypothetical protein [Endozoicomonas sp. SCSIO W0465]|uniref:hypothetical protein n=1 Tax=Endozoicomonas sp. SCSIO W0465 TaxID=2918516 RepID=UPI002075238A|nr:hypothetical protein [Endozoicomonas sp. SCSIO W0465]USE38464.1 hypothetical protein MJO57_10020 [Endozoicomonas sp. SCSIO W0465]
MITEISTVSGSSDPAPLQDPRTDAHQDSTQKAWGPRFIGLSAVAIGGLAVAKCLNHGTQCSIPRSLLNYAVWQLPTLIGYLATKPMSFTEPFLELAQSLRSMVKEEMGIPSDQGICAATSAVWLTTPDAFKESPKVDLVTHIYDGNKLKEAIKLIYPGYQSGDFQIDLESFNHYLLQHNVKNIDRFLIPAKLCEQLGAYDNPAKAREEAQRAVESQLEHMKTVNVKSVDSFPLEQLAVGESFICIMVGNLQQGEATSHMLTLTRTANGFVMFEPTMGVPSTIKNLDECKRVLEKLESIYSKSFYQFTRYSSATPDGSSE